MARPNVWRYNPGNRTLEFKSPWFYYVDLDDCDTAAEVLDWIAQISHKPWATDRVLADLVRALDDLLNFQAKLCPSGASRPPINVRQALAGKKVRVVKEEEDDRPKPGEPLLRPVAEFLAEPDE
jgi:hypothetical protein